MELTTFIFNTVMTVVYIFFAQRILDRMRLTDLQAMAVLLIALVGTFIDIPLIRNGITVTLNPGGLMLLAIAVYVTLKADTLWEKLRVLFTALGTAVGMYYLPLAFPSEPGLDLLYLNGVIAGLIAYLLGRSRRAAFAGAVFAVFLLDLLDFTHLVRYGAFAWWSFGGAGLFDSMVVAGFTGALIAEVIGEIRERWSQRRVLE